MRLFRQEEPGDWQGVVARMTAELARAAKNSTAGMSPVTPFAPVSLGELVDKITILEIKSSELQNPDQLANVAEELAQLNATLSRLGVDEDAIAAETDGLRNVNRELWKIEDDIRDKERAGDFGHGFIDLARAVYKTNDRRAALKRDINRIANSGLVEEKSYKPY